MHDENDDERGVARPNDEVRAAVLEALDLADRAGVRLSAVTVTQYGDAGPAVNLHGTEWPIGATTPQAMPHTDALRILLRASSASQVTTSEVRDVSGRLVVTHYARTRSGVPLTVFAAPSPAQREAFEAQVVEAVLQS